MDIKRRKQLLEEWKNRHPEMGVVSIRCRETGDVFLDIATDTQFAFNRPRFQLDAKMHPNKALQKLWNEYGESGFDYEVVKVLKYDNPNDDQSEKLEELLEECFAENPQAGRITR